MAEPALTDDQNKALYWISEIESAEKWRADYWKRAKAIVQRYENSDWTREGNVTTFDNQARRFAILWSNIQTLGPSVYAKTPSTVVTRRFNDPDPIARVAADVLERACNFTLDQGDFDSVMRAGRDDFLLIGQGVDWVRYVPRFKTIETPPQGAMPAIPETNPEEGAEDVQITNSMDQAREEVLDYEEVVTDHVSFDDFLTNPARLWAEVWWVSRRCFLTRAQLVERFGEEIGNAVPLDYNPQQGGTITESDQQERAKKACIYEVWNSKTRSVCWVSKGYSAGLLDDRPDPLGLTNFFPCPRPLLATCTPLSIIPIPDYVYYQDQAEEIDELTNRIGELQDALKVRGFYNSTDNVDLNNLFNGSNNTLIPVEGFAMLKEGGGARGIVEWFPVDQVITVLTGCVEMRKQLLEDVYQLTGISDILRGDSDPNETATAQGIKAQWGGLRVRDKQKELARYARDTIRLTGEVIAEKFQPETLAAMTGVKLFQSPAEKAQAMQQLQAQAMLAQQQAQAAQQMGQQPPPPFEPPPELVDMLEEPTWEEVISLLRSNAKRAFQIDIESDSTIEPDEQAAKQSFIEYVTALSGLLAGALPVLQAFPKAAPIYGEIVKESARLFRVSRSLEETVEKVFEEVAEMPAVDPNATAGDPNAPEVAGMEMQTEQIKQQGAQQLQAMKMQEKQMEAPFREAELQIEAAALQRDPEPQVIA